jgi:alpha-D-ribose 1-methylphosphonate 5-triphosphate diphosphatase
MIICNARIVTAGEIVRGSLFVSDGRIVAIDHGAGSVAGAIDFAGDYLLPGLIELHTDNLEKNLMPRPKVHWPTLPAVLAHDAQIATSGITTVLDALSVGDIVDPKGLRVELLQESVDLLDHAVGQGLMRADHLLHLRCELAVGNLLPLAEPLLDHRRLRLLSMMDHTPGQRQWTDISHYRTYVRGKKGWGEEQIEKMLVEMQAAQQRYAAENRLALVARCRERQVPLASHDDTTAEHVAESAADGVTISEFPTTLDAAASSRAHGMYTVMGAPNVVRGGSHSGNVSAADLARHDLLDALSSDYVPASLLHGAWLLASTDGWTLPRAVATVTANPAAMVGLADRGRIEPGLRADLLRVRVPESGNPFPVVRTVWKQGERIA